MNARETDALGRLINAIKGTVDDVGEILDDQWDAPDARRILALLDELYLESCELKNKIGETPHFETIGGLIDSGFSIDKYETNAKVLEVMSPAGSVWEAYGLTYTEAGNKILEQINGHILSSGIKRPEDL